MGPLEIAIGLALGVALGAVIGVYAGSRRGAQRGRTTLLTEQEQQGTNRLKLAEEEAALIIRSGEAQAERLRIQARDEGLRQTEEADNAVKKRRLELEKETERLDRRREELDKRYERLDQRERDLNKRQIRIDKLSKDAEQAAELRKNEL